MSRAFSVCTGAATGLGVTMAARQGCCEDTGCDRAFLRHQGGISGTAAVIDMTRVMAQRSAAQGSREGTGSAGQEMGNWRRLCEGEPSALAVWSKLKAMDYNQSLERWQLHLDRHEVVRIVRYTRRSLTEI